MPTQEEKKLYEIAADLHRGASQNKQNTQNKGSSGTLGNKVTSTSNQNSGLMSDAGSLSGSFSNAVANTVGVMQGISDLRGQIGNPNPQMSNSGLSDSAYKDFVASQNAPSQTASQPTAQPTASSDYMTLYNNAYAALSGQGTPSWITDYQTYMNGYGQSVDDATKEQVARMNTLRNNYYANADNALTGQINAANESAESQLTQAYVQKLQNEKNLNNQMALAGIRGGATETANLNLANQYGNTRRQINAQRDSAIKDYRLANEQNKFAYGQDMDSRIAETYANAASEKRQTGKEAATNIANWTEAENSALRNLASGVADTQQQRIWSLEDRAHTEQKEEELRNAEKQTQMWTNQYASYTDPNKLLALLNARNPDGSLKVQGEERSIIQARYGQVKETQPEIQAWNQIVSTFTPNAEARVSAINSPKGVKQELKKWQRILNNSKSSTQEKAQAQAYVNACYTRYGYLTGVDYATAQKQLENMDK